MTRTAALMIALGLLAGATVAAAAERTPQAIPMDIPAQPLADAINQLAGQANLQFVFYSEVGKGLTTQRIVGTFTPKDALTKMLANTGLSYEYLDDRTVAIRAAKGQGAQKATALGIAADHTVLAQVDNGSTSAMQKIENVERKRTDDGGSSTDVSADSKGIPELLVKGRRSLNTDIRRTEDDPQPYVVFDAQEIRDSGASNLEEFFKTRLPMNTVRDLSTQPQNFNAGFSSSVNLRGLGSDQTLILVNGRRIPMTAGPTFTQPDVKGIPINSIERIEVLPSTAGGIYGGNATGGVINIITRSDYRGVDIGITYGNTFSTDTAERRLDLRGGFSFPGGRTKINIVASRSEFGLLLNGNRDFTMLGRELWNSNGSLSASPPSGYTSNICSVATATSTICNNAVLVLDSGISLGSGITFVPVGYAGPIEDGGRALIANAGAYNLTIPDDMSGARTNLLSNPGVESGVLSLHHELSEMISGFVDITGSRSRTSRPMPALQSANAVTLAANASNNPFTGPVRVVFPMVGLTNRLSNQNTSLQAVGGLIFRLKHDWTSQLEYLWGRSRWNSSYNGNLLLSSVTQALSSGALNVMRDLNAYPLNYEPYLLPSPTSGNGPSQLISKNGTIRISGPLLRLRGHNLVLSALAERREEDGADSFSRATNTSGIESFVYSPARSRLISSIYLEARAPLVSDLDAVPLIRALEVQTSIRRDEYSTTVPDPVQVAGLPSRNGPLPSLNHIRNELQSTSDTLALSYSPSEDLTLRLSTSTGFLPPSVSELTPATPQPVGANQAAGLLDPKRGGIAGSVGGYSQTLGGSPTLMAEDSRSWSYGAIITPRVLPGLRVSIDLTHIKKTNEITTISAQTLLDLEDTFPERVTRGPLIAADALLGYTGGPVTAFDLTSINIAGTKLSTYDFQVDYTLDIATESRINIYAIATKFNYLKRQTLPTSSANDSAGFSGGPLQWRGNLGVTWEKGPWALSWTSQYFDSYKVCSSLQSETVCATSVQNQGSKSIPHQIYNDVYAVFRPDSVDQHTPSWFSGVEVSLGIYNVFDRRPPILATIASSGGYSTFGDPRLRRYSITIQKSFGH